MSVKKIKSILFYLIPLGVLFAYIFTTCYGTEIDDLDIRLTTVEEDLKAIQDKIASGKVIQSVESISGGFHITFTDGTSYDIVNGEKGAQGAAGTTWLVSDSMWYDQTNGTLTSYRAIPRDGERGADAKAPTISDDGYWTFYEWNSSKGSYDTTTSKMMADTLLMYMVDLGDYYELHTPIQEKDEYGNIVMITDPVTGTQKAKRTWDIIELPKYKPDPEPALVFKFIGYAKVLKGDTVIQLLTEDLDLQYTFMDNVHLGSTAVSEDSAMWKWKRRGPGELVEDAFSITRLRNDNADSLAVVFSINKSREYMSLLGDLSSPYNFQLRNSRNESLEAIRLDAPVFFDDKGLISKVGSNYDTLYYARMRNWEPLLEQIPVPMRSGRIYYRIVINDTVRSELSPYPLQLSNAWPLTQAKVKETGGSEGGVIFAPQQPSWVITLPASPSYSGGKYILDNDTAVRYRLNFNNDGNLFDHYIETTAGGIKAVLSPLPGDTIIKVFKVDTLLQSGQSYEFNIRVNTLQKDGEIYQQTITVKTTEP